jgi:spore coat protein CotH
MIVVARRYYWGILAFWIVVAGLVGLRIASPPATWATQHATAPR